ncbi:MAG: hypothetical protein MUD01_18105 [Chloroflexaceae bacterium]|nr:hypothetical protein [Chloroflexaceae bacterium]
MPFAPELIVAYQLIIITLTVIVHVLFAIAVASDASWLQQEGKRLIFVPSVLWILATLLGGPLVAVGYWLLHRSTLRP